MFESIRRHQKWLWVIIMSVTIVSFVAFFAPTSQQGYSVTDFFGADDSVGSINGRPVRRDEYIDAHREARLRYYFSYGQWPQDDEMTRRLGLMERETRKRLLLIEKLKEFNIRVSDASAADWIVEVWRDPQQRVFRKDAYDQFVERVLPQQGLTRADFERFARNEVGIEHLIAVAGLGGKLVTPQEAETLYRRENEQVDTQAAFLYTSNFLARVQVDPAAVANYYTNRQAEYRIPEKVQVTYVRFDATNYLAEAAQRLAKETNLAALIEAQYQQQGTNAFRDANNQPMAPDAAKAKIREDLRQNQALLEAQRQAIDFANALLELPPQTNNLANLAAAKGILSHVSEPFTRNQAPPGLKAPSTFQEAAFQLSPQNPIYEQPIVAEDAVYIIGYHKRIPSEVTPLDSIRDRVTEDFRQSTAAELMRSTGEELHRAMTNGLPQGKTFQELAAAAGATVIDLPPFSKKTPALPEIQNRADLSVLKTAAFAIDRTNQVSSFTTTRDGGAIVYLQAKVPVDESQLKAELPEFLKDLRRSRQYEAFGEWLRKEIELARITLPGDQQPQAPKAN